jgi:hypothetical protein
MLPDCRIADDPYLIPKFDITVNDLEGIVDELKGFHEQFNDCFLRSEPRENFFYYMVNVIDLSPINISLSLFIRELCYYASINCYQQLIFIRRQNMSDFIEKSSNVGTEPALRDLCQSN